MIVPKYVPTGPETTEAGSHMRLPPQVRRCAGVPGLEPRLTEPESVVLPITPYPNGSRTPGPQRLSEFSGHSPLLANRRKRRYGTEGGADNGTSTGTSNDTSDGHGQPHGQRRPQHRRPQTAMSVPAASLAL